MAGLIGEANEGSLRSSEVRWLRRGELWDDLFSLIEQTAAQVGWEIFEMQDLDLEPIQFTTYMPGCYYGWHHDGPISKFSLVQSPGSLQLGVINC